MYELGVSAEFCMSHIEDRLQVSASCVGDESRFCFDFNLEFCDDLRSNVMILQDIYNKSKLVSVYVLARCKEMPIDSTALASALQLSVNDIPLLLAVASIHTPHIINDLVLLDF